MNHKFMILIENISIQNHVHYKTLILLYIHTCTYGNTLQSHKEKNILRQTIKRGCCYD